MLISGRRPTERVLLGALAAATKAPVFTGATRVNVEGDEIVVTYLAYGGITEQTIATAGPVALVLDGGGSPETLTPVAVEQISAQPLAGVRLVERSASDVESADLASASRVVGVGRGLKKQDDLVLIEELAQAMRAEIGCSRPLAEGLDWLARDRYIGISGQHIAPKVYLAIGISGQLQHLDGAREADIIVSINSDAKAPISELSDYMLVGDLYELVPALTAVLNGK